MSYIQQPLIDLSFGLLGCSMVTCIIIYRVMWFNSGNSDGEIGTGGAHGPVMNGYEERDGIICVTSA